MDCARDDGLKGGREGGRAADAASGGRGVPAKVVVDGRWIFPQLSGIGRYTLEILRQLARQGGGRYRYEVWVGSEEAGERVRDVTGGGEEFEVRLKREGPFSPLGQWKARGWLKASGAALYHSTNFMVPLPCFPRGGGGPVRCVCNIHDLIPLKHPEYTPKALKTRLFPVYRRLMAEIARRADAVITGSEHAKGDVRELLGIAEERITVAWDGVGAEYRPDGEKRRWEDGAKTILYVGRADPYKNLEGLVRVFARLRGEGLDAKLRIAGPPDERYPGPRLLAEKLGVSGAVEWLGYVADGELPKIYRGADVLAHLSLYEGFGLPVAEAMASGLPVVCSGAGSLREIAEGAALLVAPEDEAGAAEAIKRALEDGALRERMRAAGLERAKEFTWERAGAAVLEVYARELGR